MNKKIVNKFISIFFIIALLLSGCTQKENEEKMENPFIHEVAGTRNNPYNIGEMENIHFWGYSIQSYGDAYIGITNYLDGEITLECRLDQYGYSNPLSFNSDFDDMNFENNKMIYIYPCDDPKTFSISNYEEYLPLEDIMVPCGETRNIQYKVDTNKRYVAVVYYSLKEDNAEATNGRYDFIDNELYGHIIFYDLNS